MDVKLVTLTQGVNAFANRSIEEIIVAQARVSSDRTDKFEEPYKLIRYLMQQGHWSPFEMANVGFEITTSLAISIEILRHDMHFQQYSMRYSNAIGIEPLELRQKSVNGNRQSSSVVIDDINGFLELQKNTLQLYNSLVNNENVANETARFILPMNTTTVLYVNGTIRNWISFLSQRLHHTAQFEIRVIAQQVRDVFKKEFSLLSNALFNFENSEEIHIFDQLVLNKHMNKK